jgi:hypothetical protein
MVVTHGLCALTVLFNRLGRFAAAATLHGAVTGAVDANPFFTELAPAIDWTR